MILESSYFYLVVIPAVMLYGIAKGGFAGPSYHWSATNVFSSFSFASSCNNVTYPILQDIIAIYSYREKLHYKSLQTLIPGAILGIIVGTLWFRYLSDDFIRIFIGLIAIIFVLSYLLEKETSEPTKASYLKGSLFGSLSGFISFGIHAGGLPFNMYMLPQKLNQRVLVGTAALFFGIMNYVKLLPYYLLDQLSFDNLLTSLILMPFAPLGFFIGYYLTHRVEEKLFYSVAYFCLFVVGIKLLYEGIGNL